MVELIGGHPALDFVNTVNWRADAARRRDRLVSFEDFLAWANTAKLLAAPDLRRLMIASRRHPARALRSLLRARRLREVLARILAGASRRAEPAPRDVRLINAFLVAALRHRRLEIRKAGFVWSWERSQQSDALDSLLWPIVLAAADLLTSEGRGQIRQCSGEGCGWLFLDTSRNQLRRWCSMEACGNRAKARRFYKRTREDSA